MFIVFFITTILAIHLNAMDEDNRYFNAKPITGPLTLRGVLKDFSPHSQTGQMHWQPIIRVHAPVVQISEFSASLNKYEKVWQAISQEETFEIIEVTGELELDSFLAELRRAEHEFKNSYVPMGHFLVKWPSLYLDKTPEMRRQVMHALLVKGLVELYNNAADGELAIRSTNSY